MSAENVETREHVAVSPYAVNGATRYKMLAIIDELIRCLEHIGTAPMTLKALEKLRAWFTTRDNIVSFVLCVVALMQAIEQKQLDDVKMPS